MVPDAVAWIADRKVLSLLDQRKLPDRELFVECGNVEETARAVEEMIVRGAPAIGIAAAYGVVLAARDAAADLDAALTRLAKTRPTAVNLFWALSRMKKRFERWQTSRNTSLEDALLEEARMIHVEDREGNRRLGSYGAALFPASSTVLTHCNAGAIATGGHGTALGILRSAREEGKELKVYADETRPLFQGARLTSWELARDGFDVTLICDSMAASLMKAQKIDAVLVGADRIASNGDTANKIGTYMLAVLARCHDIPFYVAAPWSTLDLTLKDGDAIPIEVRSETELRLLPGGQSVPDTVKIWNPAFDVTPADLITAIITDRGIFKAPFSFEKDAVSGGNE